MANFELTVDGEDFHYEAVPAGREWTVLFGGEKLGSVLVIDTTEGKDQVYVDPRGGERLRRAALAARAAGKI
jgi:hypothetical protein